MAKFPGQWPDELMVTGVVVKVERAAETVAVGSDGVAWHSKSVLIAILGTTSVIKVYPPRPGQTDGTADGKVEDHAAWHWNTGDQIEISLRRSKA